MSNKKKDKPTEATPPTIPSLGSVTFDRYAPLRMYDLMLLGDHTTPLRDVLEGLLEFVQEYDLRDEPLTLTDLAKAGTVEDLEAFIHAWREYGHATKNASGGTVPPS